MDIHTEDTEDVAVDCDAYDSPENSDLLNSEDEMPQEHWTSESDWKWHLTDFDDIDDVHKSQTHGDEDNILHMSLIFFMLWASFYGVSSTALNHLIKLLQYITDLFTDIGFLVLKGILEYWGNIILTENL